MRTERCGDREDGPKAFYIAIEARPGKETEVE